MNEENAIKVIVHARGNSLIGVGNLSRCYELISYLADKIKILGIFECEETLFNKYHSKNIVRSNDLAASIELIKRYRCDVYVCDLIDPDKQFSDELRTIGIQKILYFNSLAYGFEPDIVFLTNGFNHHFESYGAELYKGFEYYIVGSSIVNKRKKLFTAVNSLKNILICFGGADPALYTEYFVEHINDTQYEYTVVLGPAMDEKRKKYIRGIQKDNIKYIDNPNNMAELLLQHDMLVTLGGMMTYEAMCLGVPASAVRWSYLEYEVKNFGERQMITDLGTIDKAYQNLLNLNLYNVNKICENAYHIIDGSALSNIEKIIQKTLKEIRHH